MRIVNLYKYTGTNGEIVTSVDLPMERIPIKRLIAADDKMITNDGINLHSCLDVVDETGYYEVSASERG